MSDDFTPERFAALFQAFLENLDGLVVHEESALVGQIRDHIGADLESIPTVGEELPPSEHPNLQLALDKIVATDPAAVVVGLPGELRHYEDSSLGGMLRSRHRSPLIAGPVDYRSVPIGPDETLACARIALALLQFDGQPVVVFVMDGDARHGEAGLHVEVLARDRAVAEALLGELGRLRREVNVYRGKTLSFSFSKYGEFGVVFEQLPPVQRDDVILPEADLAAIERHSIGIAAQADALRAAGRHVKRGLLLYGPPGTGKTFSVSYLCTQMAERTTIVLAGPSQGALGQAMAIARSTAPATVVLEDVDLVAHQRMMPGMGTNPLLFALLNEMDGLAEDIDLLFVLTTNRVELLEPALSARPGRIDQAVEITLPDDECRRRLLERYLRDVPHDIDDLSPLVERTEGVSAAFIKELVRRAALNVALDHAPDRAPDDADLTITGEALGAALTDMIEHSAPILRSMLGAGGSAPDGSAAVILPPDYDDDGDGGWFGVQGSVWAGPDDG